jgi:hypothetical protein
MNDNTGKLDSGLSYTPFACKKLEMLMTCMKHCGINTDQHELLLKKEDK